MTPVSKKIMDLQECLHRLLEAPVNDIESKSKIQQRISLDKETAEALCTNATGNVTLFLIQEAQINSQVLSEANKAIKYLSEIKDCYAADAQDLDRIIKDLFIKGWKADAIENLVRQKIYKLAESSTKSTAAAARMVGIERTTFIERRKKQERAEDVIDMET